MTLVTIGRVARPHGLRGEVAVDVLSDVDGRFEPGTAVVLRGTQTTIATSRPHQARMLVRFAGIEDRTAAEALRGATIEAAPLDESEFDTYFAHELVGLPVVDVDGRELGTVDALIELPAAASYDLLEVVRDDGTTWLLPAADELVEVDAGERIRLVDVPDGLLELDRQPDQTHPAGGTSESADAPDATEPVSSSDDAPAPEGRDA